MKGDTSVFMCHKNLFDFNSFSIFGVNLKWKSKKCIFGT